MSTREQTALKREQLKGENALRRELLRNAANLQEANIEGLYRALGVADKALSSLDNEAAERGSSFSSLASRYDTSRDSGSSAARIRGTVDLARMRAELPIEFAKAAYLPDYQTLDAVADSVRQFGDAAKKSGQVARTAWQTYFDSAKADAGNALGTYREMVERYGKPSKVNFGPNEASLADRVREVERVMGVAETNAAAFDNALQSIGDTWATWLSKHPEMGPEADATYDAFLRDTKIDPSALPMPSSEFVSNIKKVAANPAAFPEVFSDIDESRKRWEKRRADLESRIDATTGGEVAPSVDDSFRAKMAAWVRRPDVQWWAKEHGLNLGTATPITPELQAEIDAGRHPGAVFINGLMYNPSPDDMRAFRLAAEQLNMDPQKNVLYAAGLTGERGGGPRRMVEVEVQDEAAPRMARIGVHDDGMVARLTDGSYVGSADGADWKPIPAEAGEALMGRSTAEDTDQEVPGLSPKTRTMTLEYRRPVYGRDAEGSVRGVDPETGRMVVIPAEKVVRREFLGAAPGAETLAEEMNAASAKRTAKREGMDLSTEAQNDMDIGEKPKAADVRARRETTDEMRQVVKRQPQEALYENLAPRKSTDAAVAAQTARSTASEGAAPQEVRNLQGGVNNPGAERGAPGTPSRLLRPAPETKTPSVLVRQPSQIDPLGDERMSQPQAANTKTSAVVTPTLSTSPEAMDAQRKVFQRTRGTGAAAGMVQ